MVEHSVSVDLAARGLGTGRALLDALIASTEAAVIWTIQSGDVAGTGSVPSQNPPPG